MEALEGAMTNSNSDAAVGEHARRGKVAGGEALEALRDAGGEIVEIKKILPRGRFGAERVAIWTDGACSGNPGPGGWGAVLTFGAQRKELSGGEPATTNNRMELMAAIRALESLPRPCEADVYTDSAYLRGGITKWLQRWKKNRWKRADGEPVKNLELWQRLEAAAAAQKVHWHSIEGHAGDANNGRADELARQGMRPYLETS